MLERLIKAFNYRIERSRQYLTMAQNPLNPCQREDLFTASELCGEAHAIQLIIHKEWKLPDDPARAQLWHDLLTEIRDYMEVIP